MKTTSPELPSSNRNTHHSTTSPPGQSQLSPAPAITPEPAKLPVQVRWMIRRDMKQVVDIESQVFGAYAWSESQFIDSLRQRNVIGLVAEPKHPRCESESIAGFVVYELHRRSLVIQSLAVDPSCQRHWVATELIGKLIGKLSPQRRSIIRVKVRESNLAALKFFAACGFEAVKVLRNECEYLHLDDAIGGREDAYLMQYVADGADCESEGDSADANTECEGV
jgi:ribosomal protein S18 acetylase RimI-like enzyme